MTIGPALPLDFDLDILGGSLSPGGFTPPPPLEFGLDILGGSLYAAQPANSPGVAPDALRVAIVDSTGTVLVPDVPRRQSLSGLVEQDSPGSVTFGIDVSDFEGADEALLDPRNRMVVYLGDLAIAEALMDSAPPVLGETGNWSYQVSGRGSLAILDNAVLYPEVRADSEDRAFDFGSRVVPYGGWYDPSQWFTPKSRNVRTSIRWTYNKRHFPKGWPETHARWLWSMNPEGHSPDGPRWFRGSLTVASLRTVRIYAAGDDNLVLKVDGNIVMTGAPGAWHKTQVVTMNLGVGTHIFAAKVTNLESTTGGNDRSGFVLAVGQVGSNGQISNWLLLSHPNKFVVTSGPPPGWYPPTVLTAHVLEGQDRGVDGYADIVFNYTSAHDSEGLPWITRRDMSIPIGSVGTDVAAQVAAEGYSVAMLPGLRLSVWRYRGRDLRSLVQIGKPEAAQFTTRVWSRVKSTILTHAAVGWRTYQTPKTGVTAAYGRRETSFSGGNARSLEASEAQSKAALQDIGTPEVTFDVTTNSTQGPQPFRDYDIADLVMAAANGGYIPARVKAITFTENTDKTVTWVTTLYPFATPVAP